MNFGSLSFFFLFVPFEQRKRGISLKFNEFAESVRVQLEEVLRKERTVTINRVTKNNGVVLHGITISSEGRNISPTIYLEEFYKEYLNGKGLSEIISEIHYIYENDTYKENVDLSFFTEFEQVKENIVYKLINYEKNQDVLEEMPYIRFLDMAIVFYCIIQTAEFGNATILIKNTHLKLWEKTGEEIYKLACENTIIKLPAELKSMEDILEEVMSDVSLQDNESESDLTETLKTGMFVLTNRKRLCGAAVILYEGILQKFADTMKKDIIILPSSVHETILLPAELNHSSEVFREMVSEVNRTQVDEQEVLSDQVYLYLRKDDKIIVMP